MTIAYRTAGMETATAVSLPVLSAPIPGVNTDYVLRQDFMQLASDYTPLALNTAHPSFPDFFLVDEPEKSDATGLMFVWTRTYAKIPATYTEPGGTYTYIFIGFLGVQQTQGNIVPPYTGRHRFQRLVQSQIRREFFLVGTGQTYTNWESIPLTSEQRYFYSDGSTEYEIDYINDASAGYNASSPSRTQYNAMMAADEATASSFSIVAESSLERWMGNIFVLKTVRVKAV